MTAETRRAATLVVVVRGLLFVLAGMLIGSALTLSLHAQSHNLSQGDREAIAVTIKVGALEASIADLTRKVDALKSEADTTEAMGAGIGLAITFLQLLGFFARGRVRTIDSGGN